MPFTVPIAAIPSGAKSAITVPDPTITGTSPQVTVTSLFNHNEAGATSSSKTTNSFTIPANSVVVVFASGSSYPGQNWATTREMSVSDSAQGTTGWTPVGPWVASQGDWHEAGQLFVKAFPTVTAGTITVSRSASGTAFWGIEIIAVTGVSLSNPVVQAKAVSNFWGDYRNTQPHSVTLDAAPVAGDAVVWFAGVNNTAAGGKTLPAGYTSVINPTATYQATAAAYSTNTTTPTVTTADLGEGIKWAVSAAVELRPTTGGPPPPPAPPTITSITPNPGPAGQVTINGTNFIPGSTVSFGGTAATNVVVLDAARITCTAPPHANGAVTVTVTTSNGTSNPVTFTYQAAGSVTPMAPSPVETDWDRSPLIFSPIFDDFDGPAGAKPNPALWWMDFVGQTPGQLNGYSEDLLYLDGQSHLVFEARKSGTTYTSARMTTRQKMNFAYGRVASSIKMPKGQGMMCAFWMLGQNWPNCSEIDIIELPSDSTTYHQTLFANVSNISDATAVTVVGNDAGDFSTGFHEYWVERTPDLVKYGIDNRTLLTVTPARITPGNWLVNRPMHVNYFLDIGGNWAGPPNASTVFPMKMLVDWFRYTPM